MLLNTLRDQKALSAFLSTLMVVGTISSLAIAKSAHADIYALANSTLVLQDSRAGKMSAAQYSFTLPNKINDTNGGAQISAPDLAPNTNITLTINGMVNSGATAITLAQMVANEFVTTCALSGQIQLTGITGSSATTTTISMKVCPQGSVVHGGAAHVLTIGDMVNANNGAQLANPATSGIYTYTFTTSGTDYYNTVGKIAITDNVHLSATIDPTLSFTITPVNAGVTVAGVTTTATSSSTAVPFGTLSTAAPSVVAQDIALATNARSGASVTVRAASNFASANGAVIDGLNDGTSIDNTVPTAGIAFPAALTVNVNNDKTWGMIGMTTTNVNNGDLTAGNWTGKPFGISGSSTAMVKLFGYNTAVRASTASTTVVYKTLISDLQEAATDYKTDMIYVATPSF